MGHLLLPRRRTLTENHKPHSQMEKKMLEELRQFEDRIKEGMEKSLKKKENKNK